MWFGDRVWGSGLMLTAVFPGSAVFVRPWDCPEFWVVHANTITLEASSSIRN